MEIREYTDYKDAEILNLYSSVGWTAYTEHPETLKEGFHRSLRTLAAYDNDRLVGVIRAVGDGKTIVYIQDVLVLPQYQRKGIGTALVKTILECYTSVRQIVLSTDNTPKTIAFYEALGFAQMTKMGCCGFMKG